MVPHEVPISGGRVSSMSEMDRFSFLTILNLSLQFSDGCHFYFDRTMMLFIYSDTLCGKIISNYFEFYVNLTFVIFVVSLDILTFWKLNKSLKVS